MLQYMVCVACAHGSRADRDRSCGSESLHAGLIRSATREASNQGDHARWSAVEEVSHRALLVDAGSMTWRGAAGAAALFQLAFMYAFWRFGRYWPGVPPAAHGVFRMQQVPSRQLSWTAADSPMRSAWPET